ncbi:predicted protein [Postia placenta Mad-698-R]|nr:predicted protein [Postia placenta Mad-698-R]
MYRVPMTVAAKSKSALTPHRPLTAKSQRTLKVKPFITVSRPLGDKTPFPNRVANDAQSQTPSPLNEKLAKLSLEEPGPAIVPGALLRPSSARTSLRIPRTSGGKYEFKTPITQGNHWDVSDGDIDVESEIQSEEQEAVQEEDYDEIEYMPPTAIIPPYEPPFEMPDYKVLGKTMWEMMHSVKFDDSADLYYAADIEIEIDVQEAWRESGFDSSPSKWERPKLPELDTRHSLYNSSTIAANDTVRSENHCTITHYAHHNRTKQKGCRSFDIEKYCWRCTKKYIHNHGHCGCTEGKDWEHIGQGRIECNWFQDKGSSGSDVPTNQ